MKLSTKEAMDTATELFSAMVFKWGFVQADPHPGNVLIRANPKKPSHPELILIDHGLYVDLPETFRHEYCMLWQSLFTGNVSEIENIAVKWGIRRQNSDIFASLTLLRPHRLRKKQEEERAKADGEQKTEEQIRLEQRVGLKERLKTMLESEELIPKVSLAATSFPRIPRTDSALVPAGTHLCYSSYAVSSRDRGVLSDMGESAGCAVSLQSTAIRSLPERSLYASMMQGNNQAVGSVSNRINILAHWAAIGLAVSSPQQSLKQLGLRRYATEKFRIVVFKVVLVFIDLGFLLTRIRSWWRESLGKKGEGLEDLLQQQVTVRPLASLLALSRAKAGTDPLSFRTWLGASLVSRSVTRRSQAKTYSYPTLLYFLPHSRNIDMSILISLGQREPVALSRARVGSGSGSGAEWQKWLAASGPRSLSMRPCYYKSALTGSRADPGSCVDE